MKRFFVLCLSAVLLLSNTIPAAATETSEPTSQTTEADKDLWPKGPSVNAKAAVLMDASTGLVLYEKNAHKKEYPASTTKILTTLLALENCSLKETVTFSHNAVFNLEVGSSHIGIDEGEKLTVEQCLYAIMLASANEVSTGIAEHISGSVEEFAKLMNARAKELGCLNTHFANANGLHNDEHYTSAYDMALIGRAAMQNPTFRKITATKRYTISPTNKHENENVFPNHHKMLIDSPFQYEYCIGGKTGYTSKAGNTLVTFAKKGNVTLVCVVMRANGPTSPENEYTDTTKLFEWGFENFTQYNIDSEETVTEENAATLFTRYSPLFDSEASPLKMGSNATVLLPKSADFTDAKREITFQPNSGLKNGDNIIGSVTYTYGGKTVGSCDILFTKAEAPALVAAEAPKEVDNKTVRTGEKWNLKPLIILVIFLILGVGGYLYWKLNRKGRRKTFDFR
ncbi:MAG: D-alanyl-D-alanine carboxypeptidase family protein [Acetivibrio ethanolgignens]